MHSFDIIKMFLALLALVNPIGAIPFFISFTQGDTREQRARVVRVASLSVGLVIAAAALAGERFIGFFGVSVDAFEVGGGVIMMLMAISMINAQVGGSKNTPEESIEAAARASIAVVPLAIPLLAGPGTISTVMIYAGRFTAWWQYLALAGCGFAIALVTFVSLSLAEPISRLVGRTGINIATRLMGLMLAALSVEFVVGGLQGMIPALRH